MIELIRILTFCFRYDFGKHLYDENREYIANLSELESERVGKWINEMNELAERPNNLYGSFDKQKFRSLIGIDFIRDSIQDMWVKVSD
jgi:hypothetical protein